jgi:thiol-disulfide isomerase/thioredoxin
MANQPSRVIDSAVLYSKRDSAAFRVPQSADSLYEVVSKFSNNRLYCIPDGNSIHILMNTKTGSNAIEGSTASLALLEFNNEQEKYYRLLLTLREAVNEAKNKSPDGHRADSLMQQWRQNQALIQQRFYDFADSVHNPAAFMVIYDHIEFANDYKKMKAFVNKAAARFPGSSAVQRLEEQVAVFSGIYEKELHIGDLFPGLELPDFDGNLFSTSALKGKYFLIDFWSSRCRSCLTYSKVKKEVSQSIPEKKLELVSVAMDHNLQACREIVKKNNEIWKQLIDTQMWQGESAKKLAFDSIPFNFLIGPDGRILAKAIKPDSLMPLIRQYIH